MIFKVYYQSMSAFYGPTYVEAESAIEAKNKFAGTAFRREEFSLIHAIPISFQQMKRELAEQRELSHQ
jgi:hypothetical protein